MFDSFDELIVTQVALVHDLVQIIAMPIRDPVQYKTAITGNSLRAILRSYFCKIEKILKDERQN